MKAMREQNSLPQQPLVACGKLDLGDRECVTQMQGPIHVWERKVSKPFGVFDSYFSRGETCSFSLRGSVDFENALVGPTLLIFLLQRL